MGKLIFNTCYLSNIKSNKYDISSRSKKRNTEIVQDIVDAISASINYIFKTLKSFDKMEQQHIY